MLVKDDSNIGFSTYLISIRKFLNFDFLMLTTKYLHSFPYID